MAARQQRSRAENADEVTTTKQPKETDRDSARRATLAKLAAAGALPKDEEPQAPSFEGVEAKDFGGTVKVGVLFADYVVHANGVWRTAHEGDVVLVPAEVADRGESLGGLVRL